MKVPLLDLKKQYEKIKEEVMAVVEEIIDSQHFILGPRVEELENKIAAYCNCKYAVGVSSGSDALLISLMSANIEYGDIVVTSPYTFFATAGAIARMGAIPFFVDIDERTYNIDPDQLGDRIESLGNKQQDRLKAIIPVHLYGQCADMEPIIEVARKYNLIMIEDAAQAIGAEYQFNNNSIKRAGSMGTYGCFSFFPSKNLGAFGDGGIVTTDDEEIYNHLKILREHGSQPKYYNRFIGGNFRLDALQAAVLKVKMKYLDEWTEKRNLNADYYRKLIKERQLDDIIMPYKKEKRHIYNQFVIRLDEGRDDLRRYLSDHGIGTEIYYPVPLHRQECFKYLKYDPDDFPVTIKASNCTLALPIYSELEREQKDYVVDIIHEFLKKR